MCLPVVAAMAVAGAATNIIGQQQARKRASSVEEARRIEQESDGALKFTLASLYPLLYRMEKRGWTKATWETTPAGVRRRCYGLTAKGVRQLGATRREWDAFFHALSRIGGLRRA